LLGLLASRSSIADDQTARSILRRRRARESSHEHVTIEHQNSKCASQVAKRTSFILLLRPNCSAASRWPKAATCINDHLVIEHNNLLVMCSQLVGNEADL
jgi:hypothetical protein